MQYPQPPVSTRLPRRAEIGFANACRLKGGCLPYGTLHAAIALIYQDVLPLYDGRAWNDLKRPAGIEPA